MISPMLETDLRIIKTSKTKHNHLFRSNMHQIVSIPDSRKEAQLSKYWREYTELQVDYG